MRWRILTLLIYFLSHYTFLHAQDYDRDLVKLYQQCTKTRLDSAHRLIVAFLRKHEVSFVRKDKIIQTPQKFRKFCDEFRAMCTRNHHKPLLRRLRIIELIDNLKHQNTTAQQASKAFEQLFEDLIEAQDYSAGLSCLLEAGLIQGHYNVSTLEALKILFFAEKFAEKHQLSNDVALQLILKTIGYYLWELDITALSTQYFQKSLETGFSSRDDSLIVLNGIGINYQKAQDFEQSNLYFEKALRYAQHIQNQVFAVVIKGNIAVNLFKTGKLDLAYSYAQQDKDMSLQNQFWENAVGAMYWLVQIELKRENFAHAKILLDSLDSAVGKTNDKRYMARKRQKEARYLYEQALKNPEKTLLAYREFVQADSLFQLYANKNKVSELKLMAEVQMYAQEMAKKDKEKQTRNGLFFGTVGCLLVLIGWLVWFFYRKGKAQKIEIQTLREQLFVQINSINQQNQDLQARITSEIKEDENEPLAYHTEAVKDEDIQQLRDFDLTQKEQWKVFKASFLRVYPAFEQELVGKVGTVSNAELRLLMLHKLGLNNNEIAKTLLISPDSVRTGKYRLYKKFGVSSAEELDKVLQ